MCDRPEGLLDSLYYVVVFFTVVFSGSGRLSSSQLFAISITHLIVMEAAVSFYVCRYLIDVYNGKKASVYDWNKFFYFQCVAFVAW